MELELFNVFGFMVFITIFFFSFPGIISCYYKFITKEKDYRKLYLRGNQGGLGKEGGRKILKSQCKHRANLGGP